MTDEELAGRVREELSGIRSVVEKKMFGGVAFMVNGKMCVTVGHSRIMCRIDPALHNELLQKEDCHPVVMRGRQLRSYVRVDEKALRRRGELKRWVALALDFNKRIRKSESLSE